MCVRACMCACLSACGVRACACVRVRAHVRLRDMCVRFNDRHTDRKRQTDRQRER